MNHHIEIYPNIFPPKWCENVIDKFKNYPFTGVMNSITLSNLDFELHKEFTLNFLEKVYPKYKENYPILNNTNLGEFNETKLHLYKVNEETPPEACENHGWHPYRCIAINLYLNSIEKGGEDVFPNQGLSIKPQQGEVLVFPAVYTHTNKSNIPLQENKYVLKGWIEFNR